MRASLANEVHLAVSQALFADTNEQAFNAEADLLDHADSLQLLRLIVDLEKRFSIKISNRELLPENVGTVGKLVSFIEAKISLNAVH